MNANRKQLIAQVRAHAEANYDAGWDVVVECYEDADIDAQIGRARSLNGAIRAFADLVSIWNERQADARHHRAIDLNPLWDEVEAQHAEMDAADEADRIAAAMFDSYDYDDSLLAAYEEGPRGPGGHDAFF
jgi:hypothetical protein